MPERVYVVSNRATKKNTTPKERSSYGFGYEVAKPVVTITQKNYKILPVLDLVITIKQKNNKLDSITISTILLDYLNRNNITIENVEEYVKYYSKSGQSKLNKQIQIWKAMKNEIKN